MALSSNRRSKRPAKQSSAAPSGARQSASAAENQSAAEEIEKLLNGFTVSEETFANTAGAVSAEKLPSPPAGLPVDPSVVTTPSAAIPPIPKGGGTDSPPDAVSFEHLPPAVTAEPVPAPKPPEMPPPGKSPEPNEDGGVFSLDDFVLPEVTSEPLPPPTSAPGPQNPPALSPDETVSPVPPPAAVEPEGEKPAEPPEKDSDDELPAKVKRPPKKAKKVRQGRVKASPGNHQNALVLLIAVVVIAIYGLVFYSTEIFAFFGKKGGVALPSVPNVSSVTKKVSKTIKKALPAHQDKAVPDATAEVDNRSGAPAVLPGAKAISNAKTVVSNVNARIAVSNENAFSSKVPGPEKQLPVDKEQLKNHGEKTKKIFPPEGTVLEGIEIVPTNTVFVEWPDIMVTGILGRGKEGGAIINDELVSIGEPCSAGPVLKDVAPMKATFEWNGDTRDYFLNTKSWGKIQPKKKR